MPPDSPILQAVQSQLSGLLPDLLGIEFVSAGPDAVVAALEVKREGCTVGGIAHGGALMALADTLGAVATVLNLPEGCTTATVESKTNFFKPARVGERVTGTCTAMHRGQQTMAWQTRLTVGERLVAVVIQTQLVLRR